MKRLRWVAIFIVVVALILAGTVTWIIATPSGTRWGVETAAGMLGERIDIARIEGTIAGPLALTGVRYRDANAGIDVGARHISLDLSLRRLLSATVEVRNATIDGVRLNLTAAAPREEEPAQPFRLDAPIDIVVRDFSVTDASIAIEGAPVVAIDRADLVAQWVGESLSVERFDLRSPQGEIHFAGDVAQQEYFTGKGQGRFRWRQGERLYAGTLSSDASDRRATLRAKLRSPAPATLSAVVEQRDTLPWRIQLEVPRFDPREELMPGSSLQSLAVSLRGSGTKEGGEVSGRVIVNGEPVVIDALRVAQQPDRVTLDSRVRIAEGEGALRLLGDIRFDQESWLATMRASWDPLTIPERWVGQDLATQGELSFEGNTAKFTTRGDMKLGPPRRQADISLNVTGSTQALELEELTIRRAGELTARGNIQLSPSMAWRLNMQAKRFNPGVFLVQWPGDLAFALQTTGAIVAGAPKASLKLEALRGRLRQRQISGDADLTLDEQRVLSGTLKLVSGQSRIDLRGAAGDTMNAVATLDMPSLTDWVPDSEGRMQARVQAQGKWPKLSIDAQVDGTALRVADIRVAAADIDVRANDPTAISGTGTVDLRDLNAAGMNFRTLRARAEGSEAQHVLTLTTDGDPVGADLRVQGGRTAGGWAGSIERLRIDVTKVASLSLERPLRTELDGGAIRFSQACLRDRDIQLCAAGASEADGSLQASYSLTGVPLGLAKIYAPPDLPLDFSGTIDGVGEIRRTAEGQLHGQARISSGQGRIAALEYDNQTLLEYRNFLLTAELDGPQARAAVSSEINQEGSIRGELAASGLGEATTGLQGDLAVSMPSLATVALFVPQVANVQGRADLRVRAAGTLDAPQLSGELSATELAAHVPELGLQLRNGRVRATPQANGDITLAGEISSGDGTVTFDGGWRQSEQLLLVNVRGRSFLAADIPAAKVVVDPDLKFTREPTRMALNGEVALRSAKVDLQKMPRSGGPRAQQASSDVVVVDEPVIASKRQDEATPLYAEVTVNLGEKVELTGYGLNATVGGRLTVRETPGEPTTGSGDITLAGTYKAYGQDLTIEQGHLLYSGTPIDNPRLNIVAVRQIEEENVKAGLRIAGTARAPQMTVFSDPAMGQAEALAYLVTGKPLDSVGAEEGDMMQSAARSLGTAAGGLLAKRLGSRLGVDEVGIKESEVLEGAAFTVGEYLSPRLYLSYGVGLFEPGEVITLRYSVTKALAVQALSGPDDMRAGVVFRIER